MLFFPYHVTFLGDCKRIETELALSTPKVLVVVVEMIVVVDEITIVIVEVVDEALGVTSKDDSFNLFFPFLSFIPQSNCGTRQRVTAGKRP